MSATDLLGMVAELKESLRVQASWLDRLNARLVELENERKQIIDALPVCPTCDGSGVIDISLPPHAIARHVECHGCRDDRMDVFRALARLAELEAERKAPT